MTKAVCWINGSLVPAHEARVSVFDHGLLYGDGVFEGIADLFSAGRPLGVLRCIIMNLEPVGLRGDEDVRRGLGADRGHDSARQGIRC